ncbi:MAG: glycosyltransferase [Pseudolabrys sp.]|nr:glycosyltransferase [Pseudolabrys sp.]MDP2297480.1 glycosyltransferase [Pseudolabrys sp.]
MVISARPRTRSLAGATILQLVPALRDDPAGHAAIDIAMTLLQSGARAIVASGDGPLVGELRAFGGEWLPMITDTINPLRIARNTRHLQKLIAGERIDIVHAQSAGAAWSAITATDRMPVFLVTAFPDRLAGDSWPRVMFQRSLARGDRVIAPSSYISRAMIERYKMPPDRITVIPRAVDTARFNPAAVNVERVAALRRAWGLLPQMRVVLVPGRIAPWNGQMSMIDAARLMVGGGDRNIAFVFVGEDRGQVRYRSALKRRAHEHGIDTLIRLVGHHADMPTALAAADVVVIPSIEPPLSGRAAAEAQALGRPVVTTSVGALPENLLCPPRMRDELRTGWVVRPGNAGELARATMAALALNVTAHEALGARARQFAEFMFSPQSVAEAIRGVYTSLLARDT